MVEIQAKAITDSPEVYPILNPSERIIAASKNPFSSAGIKFYFLGDTIDIEHYILAGDKNVPSAQVFQA